MPPSLKRNLLIIAAGVILILVLAGITFGGKWVYREATKERPHWSTGKVIQKDYQPAHSEDRTRQVYAGESCSSIYDYSTKTYNRTCTPQYRTEWYTVDIPDHWWIRIENCNVSKKDGTIWSHKDGTPKCFKKWVGIYEEAYDRVSIDQEWEG